MALRNILSGEDPSLRIGSKKITAFDSRLHTLIDDMRETLVDAQGLGLAAVQVGVLRRVVLVLETNVTEDEDDYIIELINPEITMKEGEQTASEGCLSLPGVCGFVKRPERVRIKAQDRNGKSFFYVGTGLTARAICHELDHLEGRLFVDIAEEVLSQEELEEMAMADEEENGSESSMPEVER